MAWFRSQTGRSCGFSVDNPSRLLSTSGHDVPDGHDGKYIFSCSLRRRRMDRNTAKKHINAMIGTLFWLSGYSQIPKCHSWVPGSQHQSDLFWPIGPQTFPPSQTRGGSVSHMTSLRSEMWLVSRSGQDINNYNRNSINRPLCPRHPPTS